MRTLLLGLLGLCFVSCSHTPAQTTTQLQRPAVASPPTATEIFDLRTKCAELSHKIMEKNVIGSALAQDVASHYDLVGNRSTPIYK
jgi:hypothetical protein